MFTLYTKVALGCTKVFEVNKFKIISKKKNTISPLTT